MLTLPADSDFIVNAKATLRVRANCTEAGGNCAVEVRCQLVGTSGTPAIIDTSIAWVPTIPATEDVPPVGPRQTANVTLAFQGPFSTGVATTGMVSFDGLNCSAGVTGGVGGSVLFINSKIQALNLSQLNIQP